MEIGAPEGEWLGAGDERRPKAKSEKVRRGEKLKSLRTRLFFAFFFANTKTFSLSLSARSLLFAVSVGEFFFHREILRFIFYAVTRIFVDVFFFVANRKSVVVKGRERRMWVKKSVQKCRRSRLQEAGIRALVSELLWKLRLFFGRKFRREMFRMFGMFWSNNSRLV